MFEKSHNNTIETIFEEPLDEEKFVEPKTPLKIAGESQEKKRVEKTEQDIPKNSRNHEKGNFFMDIQSELEEIVGLENYLFIHSTPNKLVEDSICASETFDYNAPDPVASDSHASRVILDKNSRFFLRNESGYSVNLSF